MFGCAHIVRRGRAQPALFKVPKKSKGRPALFGGPFLCCLAEEEVEPYGRHSPWFREGSSRLLSGPVQWVLRHPAAHGRRVARSGFNQTESAPQSSCQPPSDSETASWILYSLIGHPMGASTVIHGPVPQVLLGDLPYSSSHERFR